MKFIITVLFIVMQVHIVFALYPTKEMLDNPLFSSKFVLHNSHEKSVDRKLFKKLQIYLEDADRQMLQYDDVRIPSNIRRVIKVPKKRSREELNKVFTNLNNFRFMSHKYYSRGEESKKNILTEIINKALDDRGIDRNYIDSMFIENDATLNGTYEYHFVRSEGKYLYYVIDPKVKIVTYKLAKICIDILDECFYKQGYKFFISQYGTSSNFDFGFTYNGITTYYDIDSHHGDCITFDSETLRVKRSVFKGELKNHNSSIISDLSFTQHDVTQFFKQNLKDKNSQMIKRQHNQNKDSSIHVYQRFFASTNAHLKDKNAQYIIDKKPSEIILNYNTSIEDENGENIYRHKKFYYTSLFFISEFASEYLNVVIEEGTNREMKIFLINSLDKPYYPKLYYKYKFISEYFKGIEK